MLALEDKRETPTKSHKPSRWRALAILIFAAASCGAGFWLTVQLNAGPAPEIAAAPAPEPTYQLLDLGEIYVNLRSDRAVDSPADKLMRLRLSVLYDPAAVMIPSGGDGAKVTDVDIRRQISTEAPHIQDTFVQYLRQVSEPDLQGSYGMEMLKGELLKRARLSVGHDGPRDVLISELIIQ